jgi:glutathione peroxidase
VLVANIAALCGYTPQMGDLVTLQDDYGDQGFQVLGFYCDQFMHQAGDEDQRAACEESYGVDFLIFDIINVNPPDEHSVFTWIKSQPGGAGTVQWNFEKFLIGRDGELLGRWPTATAPTSSEIRTAIEAALAE